MKKLVKWMALILLVAGVVWAAVFFIKTNSRSAVTYETHTPFIGSVAKKTVATGKVVPRDEVAIKPQISGIIEEIYRKEGEQVKAGDLIARIKVVPDEQALNQSQGRVRNAQIALNNTKIEYNRNKALFDKGVIASQNFNTVQLQYDQAVQELKNAQADYRIIREGSAGGSTAANTHIRATVGGTILEIPVKEGDQVIQSNTFNEGTTIATVADLSNMIFEGQVDEGEVGKLKTGTPLQITLGAVEDKTLDATLTFIAPKGIEESGAVQFKIEGEVTSTADFLLRAGYSANASLILEKKDNVLVIPEALLQFDQETDAPYVEVAVGDQKFERRDIETGISDGIYVEIISGLDENDAVKQWNKTEPIKKGTEGKSDTRKRPVR